MSDVAEHGTKSHTHKIVLNIWSLNRLGMQVDGAKEKVLMRRFAADSFPQLYLVDSRERSTRQYSGIRAVEQVHFWEAYRVDT